MDSQFKWELRVFFLGGNDNVLFLCEGGALFEIGAGAETGVAVAGEYEGSCWPGIGLLAILRLPFLARLLPVLKSVLFVLCEFLTDALGLMSEL